MRAPRVPHVCRGVEWNSYSLTVSCEGNTREPAAPVAPAADRPWALSEARHPCRQRLSGVGAGVVDRHVGSARRTLPVAFLGALLHLLCRASDRRGNILPTWTLPPGDPLHQR